MKPRYQYKDILLPSPGQPSFYTAQDHSVACLLHQALHAGSARTNTPAQSSQAQLQL